MEAEKAQNAALQTYLDQMGQMLLKQELRSSEEDSELQTLARARTLAVFGQLNPEGKRIALVFLNEAVLIDIHNPIISLFSADLSEADLSGANLSKADLSGANLREANLSKAELIEADLIEALLIEADLSGADLRAADLRYADLFQADLSKADLRYADLRGAQGVTNEQLSASRSLEGATMPNGQKYED